MPPKKKSNGKKNGGSKNTAHSKAIASKYGDVPVPNDYLGDRVYSFRRHFQGTNITQAAGTDQLGAFAFQLSSLPNASEFINLFDMYKIDYVEVTFRSQFNQQTLTTASVVTPLLYTIIDLDDNASPVSLAAMENYQTCKVTRFDKDITRSFRPMFAVATGDATSATNATSLRRGWVDLAYDTVKWYGLKYGITAGAGGQTNLGQWSYTVRYYMSFKEVR